MAAIEQTSPPDVLWDARRCFARLGLSIFVMLNLASALQIGCALALRDLWPEAVANPWTIWILTYVPMYVVAIPVGWLLMRNVPRTAVEGGRFGVGGFLGALVICVFMMYAGNILSSLVMGLYESLTGVQPINPMTAYTENELEWVQALLFVVMAPIIEELVFRKALIDRMAGYGEALAIMLTAVMFGAFHANFNQFFYATGIGLVLGVAYVKSGRIALPMGLHSLVNLVGGVIGPAIAETAPRAEALSAESLDPIHAALLLVQLAPSLIYSLLMIGLAIAGLVLLIIAARHLHFAPQPAELARGQRLSAAVGNWGMALYLTSCVGYMIFNLVVN